MIRLPLVLLCFACLASCTFVQQRYPTLPPGPYRGILELEYNPIIPNPKGKPIPEKTELEFDEVLDGALPFTFEVIYETDTSFRLELHNGEEIITVPSEHIATGRDQLAGPRYVTDRFSGLRYAHQCLPRGERNRGGVGRSLP